VAVVCKRNYIVICSTICVGFVGTFRAFTSFAGGSNLCNSDLRFWIARSSFELLQDLLHCSTSYTSTKTFSNNIYPNKMHQTQQVKSKTSKTNTSYYQLWSPNTDCIAFFYSYFNHIFGINMQPVSMHAEFNWHIIVCRVNTMAWLVKDKANNSTKYNEDATQNN